MATMYVMGSEIERSAVESFSTRSMAGLMDKPGAKTVAKARKDHPDWFLRTDAIAAVASRDHSLTPLQVSSLFSDRNRANSYANTFNDARAKASGEHMAEFFAKFPQAAVAPRAQMPVVLSASARATEGVKFAPSQSSSSVDPIAEFENLRAAELKIDGDPMRAMARLNAKYPTVVAAYRDSFNAQTSTTRQGGGGINAGPTIASGADDGDAITRWNAAVEAKKSTGQAEGQAIVAIVKENPDLHREYLAAYNRNANTN